MKFAIAAVVTLALALGVESSYYPLAYAQVAGHGLSYTAASLPAYASSYGHGPAAVTLAASPAYPGPALAHGPALLVSAPRYAAPALLAPAPALLAPAPLLLAPAPAHEGQYLAKTRGSVHSAPLAGHAASAASINLAPAPGTL